VACLGVHFAITGEQAEALLAAKNDEELMRLVESIEDAWDVANLAESDKAWDAMHRCLTDGTLGDGSGTYPLSHCVLGPRQLHRGDEYIVSLVLPNEVRDVATALQIATPEWFGDRYSTVLPRDYAPEYGQQDLDYTWSNLEGVKRLFEKASAEGRAVIFTVDQ
jgi:hypothetical protein